MKKKIEIVQALRDAVLAIPAEYHNSFDRVFEALNHPNKRHKQLKVPEGYICRADIVKYSKVGTAYEALISGLIKSWLERGSLVKGATFKGVKGAYWITTDLLRKFDTIETRSFFRNETVLFRIVDYLKGEVNKGINKNNTITT